MRQCNLAGAYLDGAAIPPPSPADLIERNGGASQPAAERQPMSPADFSKLIAAETDKWAKVIKFANIKAE